MVTAKMAGAGTVARGTAGRMFSEQPERLAAAWRRERFAETGKRAVPDNLLDGCVEDFVRQIGNSLRGMTGSAWARTRGVLRLSLMRGDRGIYEEFGALRRCLIDAVLVADATPAEQKQISVAIEEAVDSALTQLRRLENPSYPAPEVTFGGLVVEVVEAQLRPTAVVQAAAAH